MKLESLFSSNDADAGHFSPRSLESFDHTSLSRKVGSAWDSDPEQGSLVSPEQRWVGFAQSGQSQRLVLTTLQDGALECGAEPHGSVGPGSPPDHVGGWPG